jgi:hypothetical protein
MNAAHAIAKDSGQTGFLNAESKEQSDQQKQTGNLDAPDLICSGHLTSFENGVPILLYDFDHRAPRGVWKGAMTVRHGANNHIETTQPVHIVGFSNQDPADSRKMSKKLEEILQRFKVARDLLRFCLPGATAQTTPTDMLSDPRVRAVCCAKRASLTRVLHSKSGSPF